MPGSDSAESHAAYDGSVAFVEEPYGVLVGTTMRVMTWNVWGRFGPWEDRHGSIVSTIRSVDPDVVLLQESWSAADGSSQAARLGEELGMHASTVAANLLFESWGLCNALLSRWPIEDIRVHDLPQLAGAGWGGIALRCLIDGPRRPVLIYNVALDWPPHASAARQHALRHLVEIIADDVAVTRAPLVVGGDFNAGPDSDEIRMLTGQRAPSREGFVLFDAWDYADGRTPADTWSRANPWAAPSLLPNRRIDYLLTGWPRRGGVGGPVAAWTVGHGDSGHKPPSDHYAVVADIRY